MSEHKSVLLYISGSVQPQPHTFILLVIITATYFGFYIKAAIRLN